MATQKRDGFVRYIKRTSETVLADPNANLAKLRTSKKLLDQYWESFFDAHNEIAATAADEAAAAVQDQVLFNAQEMYQSAMTFIEERLIILEENIVPAVFAEQPPPPPPRRDELKLTRVSIDTFDGEATSWPAFRATFESLVHNKETMDNALKLHYLNGCIGPKVKLVLQGFSMTAGSYPDVWQELLNRYDDKWKIIETHLRRFVELPNMSA